MTMFQVTFETMNGMKFQGVFEVESASQCETESELWRQAYLYAMQFKERNLRYAGAKLIALELIAD